MDMSSLNSSLTLLACIRQDQYLEVMLMISEIIDRINQKSNVIHKNCVFHDANSIYQINHIIGNINILASCKITSNFSPIFVTNSWGT